MTGQAIKPLYPSLPVSFVAVPFVWNFFTLMAGLFTYESTDWGDSSVLIYGLVLSSVFLCVIFYLPSRRHVPVGIYFSAVHIHLKVLWPVARLTCGVLLAFTAVTFLSQWLAAAVGFDFRYDRGGDGSSTFDWDDFLLVGLVLPFTDELLLRAVVLRGLLDYYRPWLAVTLSACIYVIARWFVGNPVHIFLLGCYLGMLFVRTKSLWAATFASSMSYLLLDLTVRVGLKHGLESALLEADSPVEVVLGILLLVMSGIAGAGLAWSSWRRVNQLFASVPDVAEAFLGEIAVPSEFKARRPLSGNSTS